MALAVVAVLVATGLWLAFQRIPAWYRPALVPAAEYQHVRNDLTHTVNALSSRMVAGEPFDYEITQDQLNRWLSARMAIWPGVARWVPSWLDDPMVAFGEDRIVLSGLASWSSVRSIVSLHVTLSATDDGLRVTLHRGQTGSLPVPLGPLRERIEEALAASQSAREPDEQVTAAHLFGEAKFPNHFIWLNGKVPFRITNVVTEPGRIRLRFEPEPIRDRR